MANTDNIFCTFTVPPAEEFVVPAFDGALYVPPEETVIQIQGDDNVIRIED